MSLVIHAFPASPRAFKVLAIANHLGLDHTMTFVDLTKRDQHKPEFAALNPNRRMPVMEDGDFVLWESNAIAQYLASKKPESGLLPKDERARAVVNQWMFWESTTFDPACAILIFERFVKGMFGGGEADPVEEAKGVEKFNAAAKILNAGLKGREFLCGPLTVADFSVASDLIMAERARLPLEDYPEIRRWYGALSALPAWQKTLAG